MTYWGWLIIPALALSLPIGFIPLNSGVYDVDAVGAGIGRLGGISWGDYDPELKAIAGHGYGEFATLGNLQVGDRIFLLPDYVNAEEYVVFAVDVIAADDFALLNTPPHENVLALYRCWGDGLLVVRARLKGQ